MPDREYDYDHDEPRSLDERVHDDDRRDDDRWDGDGDDGGTDALDANDAAIASGRHAAALRSGRTPIPDEQVRYQPDGPTVNIRAIPEDLVAPLRERLRKVQDERIDGDLANDAHGLSNPALVCAWLMATEDGGTHAFDHDVRVRRAAELLRETMQGMELSNRLDRVDRTLRRLAVQTGEILALARSGELDMRTTEALTAYMVALQTNVSQADADGVLTRPDVDWLLARNVQRRAARQVAARDPEGPVSGAPSRRTVPARRGQAPAERHGTAAGRRADVQEARGAQPAQGPRRTHRAAGPDSRSLIESVRNAAEGDGR